MTCLNRRDALRALLGAAALPADALAKFRQYYREALARYGIVGASLYLMHKNQVVTREFYGSQNLALGRNVDERTIYHWASITKTFTGVAIMQLRDRGRLRLDDPVIGHVPELKAVHNPHGDMRAITIRHLLTHSAGFRGPTWPWGGDQPWHPNEPRHFSQVAAMLPYTEILFPPGSRYRYSNLGIVFLGQIIERLTSDDYEVYIDKNIFKPLEMHQSYFDATPYHLLEHRAQSYRLVDGKPVPAVFDFDTGVTVSNGGLNAPLPDLVKWIDFLAGEPARQAIHRGVLKRSSLEEMFRPVLPIAELEEGAGGGRGRRDHIGLAFFVEDNYGRRYIGHSGNQNAFLTHFYLHPETRAAYIVAFNTQAEDRTQNTRRLDVEIKDCLFENVFPLFV